MSDLILRSSTRVQLAGYSATEAIVDFSRRAVERLKSEQTGQDMVEYAGVVVIVAIIIGLVVAAAKSTIGPAIVTGIEDQIKKIFTG